MKSELLFDFTVDKSTKTVSITREFEADLPLVWDAFTKAEILDQWIAPKPLVSKTKYQDFKVGGKRFYAMVSPEGQERWAIQLMANDVPEIMGKTNENENRSKIVINADSREEADKLFSGLSAGGEIEGPIGDGPWGSYFGCFRDKYGIEWIVEFDSKYNGQE